MNPDEVVYAGAPIPTQVKIRDILIGRSENWKKNEARRKEVIEELRKNIQKTGHVNFKSRSTPEKIIDLDTEEELDKVTAKGGVVGKFVPSKGITYEVGKLEPVATYKSTHMADDGFELIAAERIQDKIDGFGLQVKSDMPKTVRGKEFKKYVKKDGEKRKSRGMVGQWADDKNDKDEHAFESLVKLLSD